MSVGKKGYKEKIKGLGKLITDKADEIVDLPKQERHHFEVGEKVELYGYVFKVTKKTPKKLVLRILGYIG